MASAFAHALVAVTAGKTFPKKFSTFLSYKPPDFPVGTRLASTPRDSLATLLDSPSSHADRPPRRSRLAAGSALFYIRFSDTKKPAPFGAGRFVRAGESRHVYQT